MITYLFSNPILFFIYIITLVFTIAIHEFSHAWVADYLGDPTPRLQKRLKLDPQAHLDLMGILFLLFFGFGWGKPVEIDPYNLKNPRKDMAIISLAGPLSNFILALISSLLLRLFNIFDNNILIIIGNLLLVPFIQINLILGFFNLIPVYPLDGFKIVGGLLDEKNSSQWYELQKYGYLFLILLIIPFAGKSLFQTIFQPVLYFLYSIFIPFSY